MPTVSIVATQFLKQAEVFARGLGIAQFGSAHYPGVPMTDSPDTVRAKSVDQLLPQILQGLARDAAQPAATNQDGPPGQFVRSDWAFWDKVIKELKITMN